MLETFYYLTIKDILLMFKAKLSQKDITGNFKIKKSGKKL